MKRLRDYIRAFKEDVQNAQKVLGMNRRNLDYVYPSNPRKFFEFANNKLLTKKTLAEEEIRIPETYMTASYFYELNQIEERLRSLSSFVIKPASGSGGNGIVVISDYHDNEWISVSNKHYTLEDIKKHIADIIFGVYSFGLNDTAIIEERIVQNSFISQLSPQGLADIRVISYKGSNVRSMLRIATIASDGRANLHQGGVGVAIDLETGKTYSASMGGEEISSHPDTGMMLLGVTIPHWDELMHLSEAVAKAIPLGYLGIDIALSEEGPVVLEVNARPGIEIQNVCNGGLRESLCSIDAGRNR